MENSQNAETACPPHEVCKSPYGVENGRWNYKTEGGKTSLLKVRGYERLWLKAQSMGRSSRKQGTARPEASVQGQGLATAHTSSYAHSCKTESSSFDLA